MSNINAILIASKYGAQLQAALRANIEADVLDIWDKQPQLPQQLAKLPYDLLIIDFSLARRFLAQIKNNFPNMAVLLLTSANQRSRAVELLTGGVDDYLLTPPHRLELLFKVKRLLELRQLKQAERPASDIDELLRLNEVTQEISQTLQLDETLKIVLSKAWQFTRADLAKIYLTDLNGNLNRHRSLKKSALPTDAVNEDKLLFTLAEKSAQSQQLSLHRQISGPEWANQVINSALLMPLVSREKLIGILALGSTTPAYFSNYHTQWLSVFCNQAAIAIQNAQLFQDLSSAYIDLAQSREEILRSRNTLQVIFDGISDGLYILNQDLIITDLNQIAAERQGYESTQLIGKSFLSLRWQKSASELVSQIKETLRAGKETIWISPENEVDPYLKDREFHIYPIRNRLAQIEQVVVFAQDVSERRRWQASLFRSANLAAVGQLAGSVAHQINNPLTVTMTNSQLILLDTDPQAETYELATAIFKAGERIQNIITNLLEFSNQERYFFVQADLIDTIEGALALVIRSLKKARIQVVKDYQVQPLLSASVSHLKLVWINLLLNARDAVIDYASQPQITISTRPISHREVKVSITDNGAGISKQNFDQLFRPFFTTKPVGKALGLGLYSAHAIIERHHGQINVSSRPGLTTVEVILPLDNPRDL